MPIKIPNSLPAADILYGENIFIMDESRATAQDIRPLKIAILNLMPTKIVTETQLLRLLSNTPLQVDVSFMNTVSRVSRNTPAEHLKAFYGTFDDFRHLKFDGMIITGAPVEHLDFNDVDYWDELCEIFEWSKHNVFSKLYICWGAIAALNYYYGIKKVNFEKKLSGIFEHNTLIPSHPVTRGFDEVFRVPHSRFSGVNEKDIIKNPALDLLASSKEAGAYLIASKKYREIFITGHPEYDFDTLSKEYFRDLDKGINPAIPANYFPDNDPSKTPKNLWRSHAHLLFSNWLNYCVYQGTPYNTEEIM
ncbi:MAG: homoserine O-succinyltransferase [Ruminococcaceae bacterium]|nr:homoserine O-succinyltransferase [Oscillospiraceae bacterium]